MYIDKIKYNIERNVLFLILKTFFYILYFDETVDKPVEGKQNNIHTTKKRNKTKTK